MNSRRQKCLFLIHFVFLSCYADSYFYASPNGDGTICSAQSPCSLNQAITSATSTPNSVVNLLSGSYSISACKSISVSNNMTIQGVSTESTILIGNGRNCAFSVTSGSQAISFINLTFTNFTVSAITITSQNSQPVVSHCDFIENSSNNCVLSSYSPITVTFCRFINNNSTSSISDSVALQLRDGEVSDCEFTNNRITSLYSHGVVSFDSNGTVRNCIFNSNTGGTNFFQSEGTITNCTYNSNHGVQGGGGLIYFSSNGHISDSSFNSSFAGVILSAVGSAYTVSVTRCSFISNQGISISLGTGIISDCIFTLNILTAVSLYSGSVTNCTFNSNRSTMYGGALVVNGIRANASVSVRDCNFDSNHASDSGGAIFFESAISISNCTFTSNYASYSGGAIYYKTQVIIPFNYSITGCTFTSNYVTFYTYVSGGGAIFLNPDSTTSGNISDCMFNSNYVASNAGGGAIYFRAGSYSSINVSNCYFALNYADYGGAINLIGVTESGVSNCTFNSNYASSGGGVQLVNAVMDNCNFINNTASTGGAFWLGNGTRALQSTITSNFASIGGGGYLLNATVTNCTIENNVGTVAGGGFYSENGMITDCTFQNNSLQSTSDSYVEGGAIFCTGHSCTLENNVLANNSLSNAGGCYGGGIFLSSSSVDMINTQIQSNTISECEFSYGGGVFISRAVASCNFDNLSIEQNQIECSADSLHSESLGAAIFSQDLEADLSSVIMTNNSISCQEDESTSLVYISDTILAAPSGVNNNTCGVPYFPCTIYTAIVFSHDNTKVMLAPGNYTLSQPLEISTNITMLGLDNECYFAFTTDSNATISAENDISINNIIFTSSELSLDFPLLTNAANKRMALNNCTFNSIDSSSPSIITNGYLTMESNSLMDNNYICNSHTNCSGLILALGGAYISNTMFINNILRGESAFAFINTTICQGAVMKVVSGDLRIENSYFRSNVIYNCNTMLGSAISAEDFTQVMITSTNFQNNSIITDSAGCEEIKGGGLYLSSTLANSSVYLSNITLQNNSIKALSSNCRNTEIFGGGIHGELTGANSSFSINALNACTNDISVLNSIETKVNGGALSIQGGNTDLEIVASYFNNNTIIAGSIENREVEGVNSKGGALYTESSLTIDNSQFTDNNAFGGNVTGGAIFSAAFLSINSSSISNNQVHSNSSFERQETTLGLGGGIFTNQIANLNNVTFSYNSCFNSDLRAEQTGGALYLSQSTNTTSLNNCYFLENFATEGAAIYIDKVFDLPSMNQVSATNNTAVVSGGALFIYQWFVNNSKSCEELFSGGLGNNIARGIENNCDSMPNFLANPSNQSAVYVSPGASFEYEVALHNYFNEISFYEHYLVFVSSSANDLRTGGQYPVARPDEKGIYSFYQLAIIAPINASISLEFTAIPLAQYYPTIRYAIPATSVYCSPNHAEFTLNNQTTCLSCDDNQYSFGGECEPCPDEESCIVYEKYHGSVINYDYDSGFEILEGFWPNSFENPTGLIKCPFEESCESIICRTDWDVEKWEWDIFCDNCTDDSCTICFEGYSNYLCSECVCNEEECWYATEEKCEPCDDSVIANLAEGTVVLLIVIFALLILPSKGFVKLLFELLLVMLLELLGFVEWIEVGFAMLVLVTVLISREEIPSGIAQGFLFYIQIISSTIPDEIWTERMQHFMEHLESLNFRIYGLPCIYSGLASPIAQYIVFFFIPFVVGAIIIAVNLSKQLFDSLFLNKLYKTICGNKFNQSDPDAHAYQPLNNFDEDPEPPSDQSEHPANIHSHHPSKPHFIDTIINTCFVILSLAYYSICTLTFDIFVCDNGYLVSYPYYPCDYSTNYLYLVIVGSLLGFTLIIGYPVLVVAVLVINKKKIQAKDHTIEHRLEFLVESYRCEIFYFEFVWLMIKILLAIAKSFFESHLAIQQLIVTAILSSSLLMFVFTKPYSSREGNTVILITLVSLLFTYTTTAVYYYIENLHNFSIFISAFTGLFIVGYIIIIILGVALLKLIKKKLFKTDAAVEEIE